MQDPYLTADIYLKIKDDLGNIISGAKIYLFDNEGDYLAAAASGNTTSAIDSLTSIASNPGVLMQLQSINDHWVLVKFFDNIRSVTLSNEGLSSIISKHQLGDIAYVTINLQPLDANIVFYSPITVPQFDTITVKIGTLTQKIEQPSVPAPTAANQTPSVTFKLPPGDYTWQATSQNGCRWTGTVTLVRGNTVIVPGFSDCNNTKVIFFSQYAGGPSTFQKGSVDIKVDNILIGNLGSYTSVTPGCTGTPANTIIVYLDPSVSHTYQALSVSPPLGQTACGWSGILNGLTPGGCFFVNLTPNLAINCP